MKATVILAGQSNMLGLGILSELGDATLPSGVTLFDLNPRAGSFGPELGFAHSFLELVPLDELWLIKYAVGGSSLLAWEPDWSAERAELADDADKGPLYQRLIRHFERRTQGEEIAVLACLWMQGESDSRYLVAAAEYERNLKRLISSLRQDLNQPDLPFILGLANPPAATFDYASDVRTAQRQVAKTDRQVHLVETDGLTKLADDLHYDSAGQLELGRRFARQLADKLRDSAAS